MAKALHVRSPNPAGCDKIAHESKSLRSAVTADSVYLAIDRPVFLFDRGIAVCFANGRCLCLADERGTGRDAVGANRGFGFIKSDNGGPDIFFHARAGDQVEYEIGIDQGRRG